MNNNRLISLMANFLMLCPGAYAANANINRDQKKNVLILLVDDWGAHDLSCTGSKFYETHNLDALANESTVFSNAYVAYPRSVPSRYSLITGRHCAKPQTGCKADERSVGEKEYCIAMPFKEAGYNTMYIGKWHLVNGHIMPEDKGFDINIGGGHAGAPPTYFAPFNKPTTKAKNVIHGMDDAKKGEYLTDYMCNHVVNFIETPREKPFFAICAFYAVHTPLEAPKGLEDKFIQKKKMMNLQKDPMIKQEAGVGKTQQDDATYAAMIASVDQGIGKMITSLKETGQYDNTIIVVLSDHGGLSNTGLNNKRRLATTNLPLKAGKGHLLEGGIRVPMIIHMPNQKKHEVYESAVSSLDLLPTVTDLCNVSVDPKAELDGISLKPLITKGKQKELRNRPLYWHKSAERPDQTGDYVSSAIRIGDYKLIDFYQQGRVELYNLKEDEGETHNLMLTEPKKGSTMLKMLKKWRKENKVNMYNAEKERKKALRKKARKEAESAKRNNKIGLTDPSLPFKELEKKIGNQLVFGVATTAKNIGTKSGDIALKEFSYITPTNDFKQSYIHPSPNVWKWTFPDKWIKEAKEKNLVLRLHAPISPQCSKWTKADERTADELEKNMTEYLTALYTRYGHVPEVKWIDVVNETITKNKTSGIDKDYEIGDWFGPREGFDTWENPWTKMGFETYKGEKYPRYIARAFEIATEMCSPKIKLIINQHGNFEAPVWEKMKRLVTFLRARGSRVDGIGWQCHIDVDWQLKEGNLKRLDEFITWCHQNELAFHITEMNVWLKDPKLPNKEQHQIDTYTSVAEVLLKHHKRGEIGINFWGVLDSETQHQEFKGCLWDKDGKPKLIIDALKKTIIKSI